MRRILAMVLCLLMLSGCSLVSTTDNLMRAPILSRRQQAVRSAMERTTQLSGIIYRYPQHGEYLSPFVFYDLNGDGTEEAVIFYSLRSDSATIRVKILAENADGSWEPLHDIATGSAQIEFVAFSHILDRGTSCMLVGWQDTGDAASQLGVYSLVNGAFTPEMLRPYERYLLYDFDNDGTEELLLLHGGTAGLTVELMGELQGRLMKMGEMQLSGEAAAIAGIAHGQLPTGEHAVFIDEALNSGMLATEVLTVSRTGLTRLVGGGWDTQELFTQGGFGDGDIQEDTASSDEDDPDTGDAVSPAYARYQLTLRELPLPSADFDGDGTVEVPSQAREVRERSASANGRANISADADWWDKSFVSYMRMTRDGFEYAFTAAVNTQEQYMILMPEEWVGRVTYIERPELSQWQFFTIDPETGEAAVELARVTTGELDVDYTAEEYFFLAERAGRTFHASIPRNATTELAMTPIELEQAFILYDELK